jgi:hypothetical protein
LLKRKIRVATGVRAITAPARRPAAGPNQRRTHAYSSPTVATPISASGTSRLQELTPKRRADSPMTHRAAGGLSTVMKLEASEEPKKKAFQLWLAAWAAAE